MIKRLPTLTLLLGWTISFLLGIPASYSKEIQGEPCTSFFVSSRLEIPSSLAHDWSLIALKELYGNQIEIQERPEGPWIYLKAESKTRNFSEIRDLGIGTYNVFNLLTLQGKYKVNPRTGTRTQTREPKPKSHEKLKEQGAILFEENNDIQFGQEVESLDAAQFLNLHHMEGVYRPLLINGNDQRGINIALFFKKDLPFDIEMQSHRNLTGNYLGKNEPIFSRDLPVIYLRPKGSLKTDPPFLILVGEHLKSKRDHIEDPGSCIRRNLQVNKSVEIIEKLENQYPQVPILSIGDFNGDLRNDRELKLYWTRAQMKDSFDLAEISIPPQDRITHTYHPWQGPTLQTQLDGILVSKAGQVPGLIQEARIVRYRDRRGKEKPLPRTREERDRNPSDHFMVSTRWSFTQLIKLIAPPPPRP